MDFKKIALITGLMVTSYFLVIQWSKDYPTINDQQPSTSSITASQTANNNADINDIEVVSGVAGQTTALDTSPVTATERLISVKTDVLDVQINTKYGDIIELGLPDYPVALDQPDVPFLMLQQGNREFIARSGVQNDQGQPFAAIYQSEFNSYQLAAGEESIDVVLTWADDSVKIDKIYRFTQGRYAVEVFHNVTNLSSNEVTLGMYGQIKRDQSNDPGAAGGVFVMQSFLGFALSTQEDKYNKISFGDLDDEKYNEVTTGGWVAFLQHYFLTAWIPPHEQTNTYYGQKSAKSAGQYLFGYTSPYQTIAAGETAQFNAMFYSGPKGLDRMEALDENLDLAVDFGWLWAISKPLFHLLEIFATGFDMGNVWDKLSWITWNGFGNWGWAIIALTICVKAALYWPSAKSYRSMAKMRKLMPKMTEIREKYKDDRAKQSQEMMKLYSKEGANPIGGCLPMLLQMPIFLALYYMFFEVTELRQSPFIFWIADLSVKDPYFVLPILMGIFQFLQMRMGTLPQDPMQRKIMTFMPVGFTFLFMWFASGLVLYYVVNSALSVLQQWYVNRTIDKEFAAEKAAKKS